MIITQTPHRISFFGGGTDYPGYYLKHGGSVIGTAINRYCYLNVRDLPPFFEHKHRIVYSNQELVSSLDEIQHPSVRETLKYMKREEGISIHHDGDIPALSGMGSSSAFTVGLLNSMLALEGKRISKQDLCMAAIKIEQELIGEAVGSQDQTFAAFGGFNRINFLPQGKIVVSPIIMSPERLNLFSENLVLVFTGFSRIAAKTASKKIQNIPKNLETLNKMKGLVDDSFQVLTDEKTDLNQFGELLHESWTHKKTLANTVTNQNIDEIYDRARKNGAIGGKLLGAGNGGFMLFWAAPGKKEELINGLGDLLHVPFDFDFTGSSVIAYHPNKK